MSHDRDHGPSGPGRLMGWVAIVAFVYGAGWAFLVLDAMPVRVAFSP